jgi:nitrogen fixation protein
MSYLAFEVHTVQLRSHQVRVQAYIDEQEAAQGDKVEAVTGWIKDLSALPHEAKLSVTQEVRKCSGIALKWSKRYACRTSIALWLLRISACISGVSPASLCVLSNCPHVTFAVLASNAKRVAQVRQARRYIKLAGNSRARSVRCGGAQWPRGSVFVSVRLGGYAKLCRRCAWVST